MKSRYTSLPLWMPEWLAWPLGRALCRVLGWHNESCRGRPGDGRCVPGVITIIREGQRVLLVVNRRLTAEEAAEMRRRLAESLPEVEIGIASGVDRVAVLPRTAPDVEAGT